MKLSAQEEYGLRCLMQLARRAPETVTVPEIAAAESLGEPYVAKIMRLLREGGLVTSTRGKGGGYTLAREPEEMTVGEAVVALGGHLYTQSFCDRFSGDAQVCVHACDCPLRSLWLGIERLITAVLERCTLADLKNKERDVQRWLADQLCELGPELATTLRKPRPISS